MAHGGDAVGRADGKTVFVDGAMPGELVEVELLEERPSWARGVMRSVVEGSDDRIDPACPHFEKCGGCQWQFASRATQAGWKRATVFGQLEHLGGLTEPDVRSPVLPGPEFGYRNRMDFRVLDGQPALHQRRSRRLEPLEQCPLLAEPLQEMLREAGDLTPLHRITVRAGINTGDRLAVVSGPVPKSGFDWSFPVCRSKRGRPEPISGEPWLEEAIDGARFRVTGSAFFQNNTAGAEALVDLVRAALDVTDEDVLLDAYSGGGLFSMTVGRAAGRVLAIESAGLARDDLAHNSEANGVDVEVIGSEVEQLRAEDWTVAVCDPPRTGLGAAGVAAITRANPRAIAYVACDPASLARDTKLLAGRGYELDYATPVDMFPQTFHIETVARFHLT